MSEENAGSFLTRIVFMLVWALAGVFIGTVVAVIGGALALSLVFRTPVNRLDQAGMLVLLFIPFGMVGGGLAGALGCRWVWRHRRRWLPWVTLAVVGLGITVGLVAGGLPSGG